MDRTELDRSHITSRWLEYEGELRAGLLRVILIICFYSAELFTYMAANSVSEAAQQFHRQATYLSAAWVLVSLAALVAIARRWLPAGMKYAATAVDVGLLTAMAWFGSGASSPLVCLYALLIIMAGLRGSLKLIWFTTLLALAAYWGLLTLPVHATGGIALSDAALGDAALGDAASGAGKVPIQSIEVMVITLGIAASGIVTGQLVRMLRQVVSEVCLRTMANASSAADQPEVQP